MGRTLKALVSTSALQHNINRVRQLAPNSSIIAMVKANGYGHGLDLIAEALSTTDAFGVACIEEALILRNIGIKQRIILMEGFFSAEELDVIVEKNLEIVVHERSQLNKVLDYNNKNLKIWLKIDTGMNRLGFSIDEIQEVYRSLADQNFKNIIGAMTHFSCADEISMDVTKQQIENFRTVIARFPKELEISISNSAGIISCQEAHADWVRPGLMIYGVSPFEHLNAKDLDLKPVMTLETKIIAIKEVKKGSRIGYNGEYVSDSNHHIGIIAIGYGDGYPQHVPKGTSVLLHNKLALILGKVSMDMAAIDLRLHPEAQVGDSITLWGPNFLIEDLAKQVGRSVYELLAGVGARVHRLACV